MKFWMLFSVENLYFVCSVLETKSIAYKEFLCDFICYKLITYLIFEVVLTSQMFMFTVVLQF